MIEGLACRRKSVQLRPTQAMERAHCLGAYTGKLQHAKWETFDYEWQWWHLVKNSRPISLDETPDSYGTCRAQVRRPSRAR